MTEPYYISYQGFYLQGFSGHASPLWSTDLAEALWFEEELARRWIRCLQILFDLSGLELNLVNENTDV